MRKIFDMFFYAFIWVTTYALSFFFFRMKTYGRNNIPRRGTFILASNHTSYLDPMVIPWVTPRRLSFISRDSLFKIPVVGFVLTHLGSFPIKRESSDVRAIRAILERLERRPVLFFPQGTRHKDRQDIKAGVGFLAVKSGKPVIPVFIKGADHVLAPGARWPRYGLIEARFGKPMVFPADADIREVSEKIMADIEALGRS